MQFVIKWSFITACIRKSFDILSNILHYILYISIHIPYPCMLKLCRFFLVTWRFWVCVSSRKTRTDFDSWEKIVLNTESQSLLFSKYVWGKTFCFIRSSSNFVDNSYMKTRIESDNYEKRTLILLKIWKSHFSGTLQHLLRLEIRTPNIIYTAIKYLEILY